MNLYHFEEVVGAAVVGRGMEYYEAGFVTDLVHEGEGRYTAVVKGADMYEIAVQLDEEGNILSSACDCPFTAGPVCKHEVAVYYKLIDGLKEDGFPEAARRGQPDLKAALENLSKGKLIEILIDLADEDPVLHNELLFHYSIYDDEQQEIEHCERLMDSIISKYLGIEGFISYRNVGNFAEEMSGVLRKVERMNDPLNAMKIARLLLTEGMKAFQYADDSNGDIGGLIDEAIKKMDEIAQASACVEEQNGLFEELIDLSKSDVFDGWDDFRIDVLDICLVFADNEQMRTALMNELESIIDESSANGYGHYTNERVLNLIYDLLETYGSTEEAGQFLQEHISYPSFRKRLMQIKMDEGDYESVLALASEGERMDKDYLGLAKRWKKWRYRAYKQMGAHDEQMKIGRELLIDGEFEYYRELKELAADDSFYEALKQELAVQNEWMYVQLIEAENDIDAILAYVREKPSVVERYLKYLVDSHKDEAVQLFQEHVRLTADHASNRKQYKDVCQMLKRFRQVAGREVQLALVEELRQTYKNRPAFQDELGKL